MRPSYRIVSYRIEKKTLISYRIEKKLIATQWWRGRPTEEQEAGVEGEGGEGDAVGDQDEREISITTWADNSELIPRGIREELWNIILL